MPNTNLQFQKRSNKPPKVGDVFALMIPSKDYLFGRVVGADLPSGGAPMPGSNLIYVYDVRASSPQPDLDSLRPERLLIPPTYTNNMLWTRGYAVNQAHEVLDSSALLAQHCFAYMTIEGRFLDEKGSVVPQRTEPCGIWGLQSYRAIDDLLSDALGIPLVPIEPGD